MAKLHSYYMLCPLIDQKSFLGVSEDKDEGCVVVTLGRNVVNKYRLSDQKQVGGWTSKDHITAPVVYDSAEKKYVSVFYSNIIKIWRDDVGSLDKINKHKFGTKILKIVPRPNNTSLVIFSNGNCASLNYSIEEKKSLPMSPVLRELEEIMEVGCFVRDNQDHVCYLTRKDERYEIVICQLIPDIGTITAAGIERFEILPEDVQLRIVGKFINTVDSPTVYIIWNNGEMLSFDLYNCKWKIVGNVPWISTAKSVSMNWMGEKHLALYGTGVDQDGAVICAYNVALGVGSCQYPLKMYCDSSKIYCISDRMILEAGNTLGILPYALVTSRNLSTLIGTHNASEADKISLVDWGVGSAPTYDGDVEWEELLKRGMTERNICLRNFPKLLQNDDYSLVLEVIKQFEDIPEKIVVSLLKYAITLFKFESSCLDSAEEFKKFCESATNEKIFLSYIFQLDFSDSCIIPFIRNNLELDQVLFLLMYICFMLEDQDDESLFDVRYERKLLDWCSLLLDSFYQQYFLSSTKTTKFVLNRLNEIAIHLTKLSTEIENSKYKLVHAMSKPDVMTAKFKLDSYKVEEVIFF